VSGLRAPRLAGCILLPRALRDRLAEERHRRLPNETGGYLIGRWRGSHIEITDATLQGAEDVATPVSFERVDGSHRQRAVQAWTNDHGLTGIVGDWHSHPGPSAPSWVDKEAWRVMAKAEQRPVAGMILGATDFVVYRVTLRWHGASFTRQTLLEETGSDFVYGAHTGMLLPKAPAPRS